MIRALLIFLLFSAGTQAQTRFVSDEQYVPLRSGPGSEYRIVHRGIPSGTELTVEESSEDGEYSRIVTARGTEGWIRSQYLVSEVPAKRRLANAEAERDQLQQQLAEANATLAELRETYQSASDKLVRSESDLTNTRGELAEIKRISANALSLDQDKKRLLEEAEIRASRIEVLEAENQRLQDSAESEAFLNGALAVLLGVMITLLVPRLWPKRRPSSSWA